MKIIFDDNLLEILRFLMNKPNRHNHFEASMLLARIGKYLH